MTDHQHRFDHVEDYLHHRSPYLMVDRILSITDNTLVAEKRVTGDEFFFAGHFPGAPIVPGAMMQEMTTQSAGILIAAEYNPMATFNTHDPHANEFALGVLVKVKQARYRGFARPGDQLTIEVKLVERTGEVFEFIGKVLSTDKTISKNRFQLTNLASTALRG
ncbi:3-hydroxyacyl-ACP dehydratase FabZ family protein [Novipirellula artificiosorum]|uniref:3-hydroxyacyl-[acyl-carrier-protein] dehydratase FabZ n=1 Tax=Novipirellula artificiosorum TaxID=2528016 RepID=A0A5C6DXE4_9BACT|nr:3-hydroxyacyl-ACP dehydratase FabZ family protein [Novipirellula artificiosorum]TWU42103.1 3-hydroxyacyl-[acyl-carrier-protein] dehydratase FabZ [Novipirellula artificiosorum]